MQYKCTDVECKFVNYHAKNPESSKNDTDFAAIWIIHDHLMPQESIHKQNPYII